MTYIIADNYSVLNNYRYEGKSPFMDTLDTWSAPCREILGGRQVNVMTQTYGYPASTARKVTQLFFVVLIFPIAVVSLVCLIIKLSTCPFNWEKKIVKEQSEKTREIIDQFNKAVRDGEYNLALQKVGEKPAISMRTDVNNGLFKIINMKINDGRPWQEIQNLMPVLMPDEATRLIDYAIKRRLLQKDAYLWLEATDIESFIRRSLRHAPASKIEACYRKVILSALKPDSKDDLLRMTFKLDLANRMIQSFKTAKLAGAQSELQRLEIEHEARTLKWDLEANCKELAFFTIPENAEALHVAVQAIRDVNRMGINSLDKLKALSSQSPGNPLLHWQAIRGELSHFQEFLDDVITTASEKEQEYFRAIQGVFDSLIKACDSLWQGSSPEEFEAFSQEYKQALSAQNENIENLFEEIEDSPYRTSTDLVFDTLRMKKKADLLMFAEKIKTFLVACFQQAALALAEEALAATEKSA